MIEFCTREYAFTHGRQPRGQGMWAFQFGSRSASPEFIPGTLTYAEAKKAARAIAKQRGVFFVVVCT